MDISYALHIEDYSRTRPLQGLEELAQLVSPSEARMQQVPRKADLEAQNAEAVQNLNAMLSGVQGGPRRRRR